MKLLDDLKAKFAPKTPAERERLKKIAVYTVLCLSCLVCIWLIFAPSGDDEAEAGKANMELPEQTSEGLPETKMKAYEQEDMNAEKQRQDSTVLALAEQLDSTSVVPVQSEIDEIQNSAAAYQAAQASLNDFYIPETSEAELQVAELQARIDELESANTAAQQQAQPNEMELLERSYQLAAQYMGNGAQAAASVQVEEKGKRDVQPVAQVVNNVVSTLSNAQTARGFYTSVGSMKAVSKNTISAVVVGDQTISNGQTVKLRLTEPMWVGTRLIPRNTIVVGASRLNGERLEIEITSIESEGSVYEVELQVYDSDGQEGINIPNSMESEALQEIGANMGSTVGSSINISTDAGAQIVSDVGRGLLNGVSQYLTKKVREVKVKLKANYRVMLHQPEQN